MKKSKMTLAMAVILSGSILLSSCIGSFGLFNNMLNWNEKVGNKFVNELVFLAFHIIPVYEICYLADILVINSIEFWSGNNPIASVGQIEKVKGENGNYLVKRLQNGYSITKEGETTSLELTFDEKTQIWSAASEGNKADLIQMNQDGTAKLFLPDGTTMDVTLDAQGKIAASEAVMTAFAAR